MIDITAQQKALVKEGLDFYKTIRADIRKAYPWLSRIHI